MKYQEDETCDPDQDAATTQPPDRENLVRLLAAEVILRVAEQAQRRRLADRTPGSAKISAV